MDKHLALSVELTLELKYLLLGLIVGPFKLRDPLNEGLKLIGKRLLVISVFFTDFTFNKCILCFLVQVPH